MAPSLKDVLWTDGEEVTIDDLNDMQRFAGSQLNDAVLGSLCWSSTQWEHGTFPDASTLYCLRGGGMPYYIGALGVSMGLNPGLIAVATAGSWWSAGTGDDANFVFAYLTTNSFTFTANASGNPRYDLIQVAITNPDGDSQMRHFEDAVTGAVTSDPTNKKRTRTATVSVKEGTPAGSPTVPTPDTGYLALAAVLLNDGYAGGTARPNGLIDYRVPMGATVERVFGRQFSYVASANWSLDSSGPFTLSHTGGAGGDAAYASPPVGSHHKRLMKIGLCRNKNAASTSVVSLARLNLSLAETSLLTLTSSLMVSSGIAYEEYALAADAPVWANGYTSAYNIASNGLLTASDAADTFPALKYVNDGSHADAIHWARFFFAGGM